MKTFELIAVQHPFRKAKSKRCAFQLLTSHQRPPGIKILHVHLVPWGKVGLIVYVNLSHYKRDKNSKVIIPSGKATLQQLALLPPCSNAKLHANKNLDRIRLPASNFPFELLCVQGLSAQITRSLERTGQELCSGMSQPSALPAGQHSGPYLTKTSFTRSHLRLLAWSAWISNVPPSGTFPLKKSKKIFQKSYVYEMWLTIHYSLDSGCWLFRPSEHELPTRFLVTLWI